MTRGEFVAVAEKTGKLAWKGLQKLTIGAAMVISMIIHGIFGLIRDYFQAKREFWRTLIALSPDRQMAALLIEHAKEKQRSIVCWSAFATPILLGIFCGIGAIDYEAWDSFMQHLFGFICLVLFLFFLPATVFSFQVHKLEAAIRNLNNFFGGQNEHQGG